MAMKAAAMTPTQIRDAGFAVFQIGWKWTVWGLKGTGRERVLGEYSSRWEAVADLADHITNPDGMFYQGAA